ncbi:MAG: hypothetical protein ROM03_04350 [Mucispirillum sp.]|nr:hypothetical protein [Mucispirillum sp.]
MFEKLTSFKLDNLSAFSDTCSSVLKRIKFVDSNSFIILENTFNIFTFYHMNLDGEVIHKWEFEFEEDMLLDYIYIDGRLYLVFISQYSQYEESIDFYCSNNEDFEWIGSMQKESYMHDMDFLHIFNKNNKVRFLIIRHNRLHLYTMDEENNNSSITIDDDYEIHTNLYHLIEIAVLEGSKWVISNGYAVNIKGKLWEIYNTDLELVCSFEFTDDLIDWLGIAVSDDGSLIAAATDCSEEEKGALAVYNKKTGQVHTHFQRYGFFSTGIAAGRVWATIASSFSDIGGLMIFDKEANLKYASLKDEEEGESLRAYNPSPIIYQALSFEGLPDYKVLIITDNSVFLTDLSCRNIQDLPAEPYECIDLSKDKSKLIMISYVNRLYGGNPDQKYSAEVVVYKWSAKHTPASIVDLKSYRKN